jgi:hypothetical protein
LDFRFTYAGSGTAESLRGVTSGGLMSTNGNRPGQGGSKTLILAGFLALGVGAAAVYALGPDSDVDANSPQRNGAARTDQPTSHATVEQDQPPTPTDVDSAGQGETNDNAAGSAVQNYPPEREPLIATDDPSYLACLDGPLQDGEDVDQRVFRCNRELAAQQTQHDPGPSPAPDIP